MELRLAVDLGGTKVEAALVRADGALVPGTRFRAPTGAAADRAALEAAVDEVVRRALGAAGAADVAGAGIGSAGPVDLAAGSVSPLNLPALAGYPIVAAVAAHLPGRPVLLARDGICIALAEHRLGAGRGVDALLGMVVSTGVGGGIVLGGRPLGGATGNAGHIGQVEVAGFTEPGVGSDPSMLEEVASGPGTVAWARARGWRGATGEDLAVGVAACDPVAIAAVSRSATAVGQAITSATALIDVDLVVIGGGFSRVAPDYIDRVRAARDRTGHHFLRRARIVAAELGDEGPLVGAAALLRR